ncbi:MAG: hypothetical protein RL676_383 [Pseudomonadota bacterium]
MAFGFLRLRWVWVGGLVLVAVGLYAWMGQAQTVQSTPVVQAYPSQAISVLNATGYVVAQRKAALSSKATGRLEWLGVAEGSSVTAGQVLARLESRDVVAQLDQARAQVGVAQADLRDAQQHAQRSERLLGQKFISASSHDATIARLEKAKAAVAAAEAAQRVAEANVAQTEIRAPFDAVVLTKNANVGDNITPFSSAADSKGAVVTIADMSTLEVETDVSESNIGKLSIGQPAEIALDALPGERFLGEVVRMVPTMDRSKATRLVKVKFQSRDDRVLPDMSAKVVFLQRPLTAKEQQPIVAVSRQALAPCGENVCVYVIEQDHVKQVVVGPSQASDAGGDLVPVPMLKPGARVVIRPSGLRDGQRIRITAS